ncbi:hypothetical protein LTR17_017627 [Elasticomyces elasticus]|nr:hypothetical protein LTR17_017627 [Elasticomyces elasticus]
MTPKPGCKLAKRVTKDERTIASTCFKQVPSTYLNRNAKDHGLHFAIYDDSFVTILGRMPNQEVILWDMAHHQKFAHEAPVYVPHQDTVYFTSNVLRDLDGSNPRIAVNKATRNADGYWSPDDREGQHDEVPTSVSMGNGAINYGDNSILFCAQGTKTEPGGLVVMQTKPPHSTTTLIDSYHGRLFNSVNDVVLHPDGSIWFTDPTYGYEQDFRNEPVLPCQVYRFEPETGDIRVVADGFGRPNGLCFSPDHETMYITDTDMVHGDGIDLTRVGTIYAFDVIERHGAHFLANRRVFAMADNGFPDGIKCDLEGNVYSGCGDGVNVWNAGGRLIGKILVDGGVANFCFMRPGEILMLNETNVYIAHVGEHVEGALLHGLGIEV